MFARLANRVGVRVSEVANAVESSPRVVIAIVATDEAQNIVGCLRSLNRFLYRDFGIIICENGGYDPFERDLRELAKMDDVAPATDYGRHLGRASGEPAVLFGRRPAPRHHPKISRKSRL